MCHKGEVYISVKTASRNPLKRLEMVRMFQGQNERKAKSHVFLTCIGFEVQDRVSSSIRVHVFVIFIFIFMCECVDLTQTLCLVHQVLSRPGEKPVELYKLRTCV